MSGNAFDETVLLIKALEANQRKPAKGRAIKAIPKGPKFDSAREVFVALVDRINWRENNGCAFPSVSQIAEDSGRNERVVKECTAWLQKSGFILKRKRRDRSSLYTFPSLIDAPKPEAIEAHPAAFRAARRKTQPEGSQGSSEKGAGAPPVREPGSPLEGSRGSHITLSQSNPDIFNPVSYEPNIEAIEHELSYATLQWLERWGVDQEGLLRRFAMKTQGTAVNNIDAYVMAMAIDEISSLVGVPEKQIREAMRRHDLAALLDRGIEHARLEAA